MTKPAETDTPLFGTQSDVLETAARSPVPSTSNTTTNTPETKPGNGDFFSSASTATSASDSSKSNGTAARNENSALFSLAQLSVRKTDEPADPKPHSDSIIDLKSLAEGAPALDTLLGNSAIASALASPVLAPVPAPAIVPAPAESKSGINKTVLFSVLGSSIILVGGALGVAMILRTAPTQTAHPTGNTTPTSAATNAAASLASSITNGTAPETSAASLPSNPATEPTNYESNARRTRASEASARGARASRASTANARPSQEAPAQASSVPTQPATPTVSPCVRNCRGDIGCIVRCQSSGGGPAPTPSSSTSAGVRDAPSRADVLAAMNSVRSAVMACATGTHGTAMFTITFANTGRVTTVNVGPPLAATPAGSCAARAVRAAVVPPFSRPTLQVNYPFSF